MTHVRAVFALHGVGWLVLDHLLGASDGPIAGAIYWHLHPAWHQRPGTALVFDEPDGASVAMACSTALQVLPAADAAELDRHSAAYGRIDPSLVLRSRIAGETPHTVATFIAATVGDSPTIIRIPVTEPPDPSWHAASFRLIWQDRQSVVLSAVERHPGSVAGGAPAGAWGGPDARIEGRAAVVPLDGRGSPFVAHGAAGGRVAQGVHSSGGQR